jgi:23S rRNA pseudouridine1911/1915/1917 synthase
MDIPIFLDSRDLVVCEKPRGILSQSSASGDDSMVSRLEAQLKSTIFPVHRLDREVGGVMVYAKNQKTAGDLSRQIQQGKMQKEYLAAVHGLPEPPSGLLTDLLYHDRQRNKTYVVDRPRKGVKEARLKYRVLDTASDCALVQILLLTGRTHQIRVQFSSRKLPLLGDGRYGGGAGTVQLWSARLRFFYHGPQCFTCLPTALGPFAPSGPLPVWDEKSEKSS